MSAETPEVVAEPGPEPLASRFSWAEVVAYFRGSWTIGKYTWREGMRKKTLIGFLILSILVIFGSSFMTAFLTQTTVGDAMVDIEAKLINPDLEACGADVSRRHVLGAAANARAAGVEVHLAVGDVKRLGMRGPFDAIVCNPPYGIRERAVGGLVRVYESLMDYAGRALRPGGRLCLVTPRATLVKRALKPGLGVVHQRRIVQGGMQSKIILIERFT